MSAKAIDIFSAVTEETSRGGSPRILSLIVVSLCPRLKLAVVTLPLGKVWNQVSCLNAELPQNSRLHILEQFHSFMFDYLIATDDSQLKEKEQADGESRVEMTRSRKHAKKKMDSEFGVVGGIAFRNVHTVINFDMPQSVEGYVHRIGCTGRAYSTGASISLVSA